MLASRGVDSHPQDAHLRDTRGVVRFKLGRLDDAIQDLEHSASLAPTNSPTRAKALLHLSRVLVAKGDKTGARRRAEEAVKIDERIHCLSEDERGEVARLMGG